MDVKTAQNDHLQNALRLLWGHRIAVPHSRQFCFRRLCGHSTLRCWRHLTDRSETFQQTTVLRLSHCCRPLHIVASRILRSGLPTRVTLFL